MSHLLESPAYPLARFHQPSVGSLTIFVESSKVVGHRARPAPRPHLRMIYGSIRRIVAFARREETRSTAKPWYDGHRRDRSSRSIGEYTYARRIFKYIETKAKGNESKTAANPVGSKFKENCRRQVGGRSGTRYRGRFPGFDGTAQTRAGTAHGYRPTKDRE